MAVHFFSKSGIIVVVFGVVPLLFLCEYPLVLLGVVLPWPGCCCGVVVVAAAGAASLDDGALALLLLVPNRSHASGSAARTASAAAE